MLCSRCRKLILGEPVPFVNEETEMTFHFHPKCWGLLHFETAYLVYTLIRRAKCDISLNALVVSKRSG